MAANQVEVNINVLSDDVNKLSELLTKIRSRSTEMFEDLDVLDTMWEGEAHEAFRMQVTDDRANMEKLALSIEKLIDYMRFASREYNICEEAVINEIGTI